MARETMPEQRSQPAMSDDQRTPPLAIFRIANRVVRPLLRSPLHRLLSGQIMLLAYRGRRSGQEHTIPIGYFAWDDDTVLSFSSARWWINLREGRPVRLLMRGHWRDAVPTVAGSIEERATLLGAFARRYGPQRAGRLPVGLPNDRQPTEEELQRAATKTAIVHFALTT
jgi:hypothetical protein